MNLDYYGLTIAQKDFDDGAGDYAERTFIWNSTQFKLGDLDFVIDKATGELRIEGFNVLPFDEIDLNFDVTFGWGKKCQSMLNLVV